MGLFSSIKKGLKKIASGVKKVFKKVGSGIKKFASSKLGKVVMIAAAIYTGGLALGAWQAPAWMGGAAAGASAGATAGATTGATAGYGATIGSIAQQGVVAGSAMGGAGATTTASALAGAGGVTGTLGTAAQIAASNTWDAVKTGAKYLADKGSSAAAWSKENPMATYIGGQMLQSAMAEDPVKQQMRMEQARRDASNIYGVSGTGEGEALAQTGLTSSAQPPTERTPTLQPPAPPQPGGLISQAEGQSPYQYQAPTYGYQGTQYG